MWMGLLQMVFCGKPANILQDTTPAQLTRKKPAIVVFWRSANSASRGENPSASPGGFARSMNADDLIEELETVEVEISRSKNPPGLARPRSDMRQRILVSPSLRMLGAAVGARTRRLV